MPPSQNSRCGTVKVSHRSFKKFSLVLVPNNYQKAWSNVPWKISILWLQLTTRFLGEGICNDASLLASIRDYIRVSSLMKSSNQSCMKEATCSFVEGLASPFMDLNFRDTSAHLWWISNFHISKSYELIKDVSMLLII